MSLMEICLLVIGVVCFVLSFLISDKKGKKGMNIDMDAFNSLMEKEMNDAKQRVSDIVDETIEYAVEKTERAAERLSNEKIMAINEYSDTVLADVNKAHQEVMFLYDMLNDKQKTIKKTVKEVETQTEVAKVKAKEAEIKATEALDTVKEAKSTAGLSIEKQLLQKSSFTNDMPTLMPSINKDKDKKNKVEVFSFASSAPKYERVLEKNVEEFKPLTTKTVQPAVSMQQAKMEEIVTPIIKEVEKETYINSTNTSAEESNNDKILRLNREGMTSVDIAKQLGLGVGEVKLVLNLFKGAV